MDFDADLEEGQAARDESEFREVLREGRHDRALEIAEQGAEDSDTPDWLVTSMLEAVGLSLAAAGRYDESIAAFERALELDWDVIPDGRCEIARVLLEAGRNDEADALWKELRDADPDGVWTLNAGGLSYNDVGRDEEAVEWLAEGLRVALAADDPEQVVDQMSDARRLSLRRLGREPDALEHEVEAFRAKNAVGETMRLTTGRAVDRQLGIPARGASMQVVWFRAEDDLEARRRWPMWVAGLAVDEPFPERAARMEWSLRSRRAEGDGPFVVVTIDLEHYARWCEAKGYHPADRRSRGSYIDSDEREVVAEQRWPPGRNEPCWCGSERKYKRCCGSLPAGAEIEAAA